MGTTDDLTLAIDAAHAAGALLQAHWNDPRPADHRRQASGATSCRRPTTSPRALLRDRLLGANPDDGWLGEETDARPGRRRWIVDPLDGTTNFLRGIAHWAVSIALEQDGQLVLGVVHDPLKGRNVQRHDRVGAAAERAPPGPCRAAGL